MVSSCTDILEELNLTSVSRQIALPLEQENRDPEPLGAEAAVLHELNDEPIHIDDIHRNANLPIASVSGLLTMLEMKGMVKQVGCMHYVRIREAAPAYGS